MGPGVLQKKSSANTILSGPLSLTSSPPSTCGGIRNLTTSLVSGQGRVCARSVKAARIVVAATMMENRNLPENVDFEWFISLPC